MQFLFWWSIWMLNKLDGPFNAWKMTEPIKHWMQSEFNVRESPYPSKFHLSKENLKRQKFYQNSPWNVPNNWSPFDIATVSVTRVSTIVEILKIWFTKFCNKNCILLHKFLLFYPILALFQKIPNIFTKKFKNFKNALVTLAIVWWRMSPLTQRHFR